MRRQSVHGRRRPVPKRDGVAAVEAAIVLPLIALLFIGSVDMGQFAGCYRKVSEASREGARVAARFDTLTIATVRDAVYDDLSQTMAHVDRSTVESATTVTVHDAMGTVLSSPDFSALESGDEVRVTVSVQFDQVRWISGLPLLSGSSIAATTIMRKE